MYSSKSREYSYYFNILKLLRYMSQEIISHFLYTYTLFASYLLTQVSMLNLSVTQGAQPHILSQKVVLI